MEENAVYSMFSKLEQLFLIECLSLNMAVLLTFLWSLGTTEEV